MTESGYYPPGAEYDSNAPWNEEDYKEEVKVIVSVTLSKEFTVTVNSDDISEYSLKNAVEEQIVLPQNMASYTQEMFNHDLNLKVAGMPRYLKEAIADCSNWDINDFEVIENE